MRLRGNCLKDKQPCCLGQHFHKVCHNKNCLVTITPSCCHLLDICAQLVAHVFIRHKPCRSSNLAAQNILPYVHPCTCTTMWRAWFVPMPPPSLSNITHNFNSTSPPIYVCLTTIGHAKPQPNFICYTLKQLNPSLHSHSQPTAQQEMHGQADARFLYVSPHCNKCLKCMECNVTNTFAKPSSNYL